jgi:hypothetical protein
VCLCVVLVCGCRLVGLALQMREFVSLFGLLASCPEGRVLLTTVSNDPSYSVTTLLKPVAPGSDIGTGSSGECKVTHTQYVSRSPECRLHVSKGT